MAAQLDDQIGFSSVTISDSVTFFQLPNIPCHEIWIGVAANFYLAGSATPGANVILLASNTANLIWIMIPTGGNANNLFMKNDNATPPFTIPFMWRNPRTQLTGPAF
jgi:hypothetical protein